jgi:hypothetical protein
MKQQKTDSEARLYRAVDIARFAPSSHNCQPWQIRLCSVKPQWISFELQFDQTRMLDSLPSLTREMYLGCGIFLEFLLQVLAGLGMQTQTRWLGHGRRLIAIEARLTSAPDERLLEHLIYQIQSRRTVRAPYRSPQIPAQLHEKISHENSLFDGNVALHCGTEKMKTLATLCRHYASLDFSNRNVWRETFRYIHFDETQATEDGFYFSNLFGQRSAWFRWAFRLGLHPSNHWLYSLLSIPAMMASTFSKLVSTQGHIMTLTAGDESAKSLFVAGRSLGRFTLKIQQMNWVMHPLSVLVQHDEPRARVAAALDLHQPLVYIARLGQCSDIPRAAPRRAVDSIIVEG